MQALAILALLGGDSSHLAVICLRHPIEILLISLGFGRRLQAVLEGRIAEGSRMAADVLALELAYANLERVFEKQGEYEAAAKLVGEQANHPSLSDSAAHAYIAAAHRILEDQPDLARRYVESAKGYLEKEIFDREWLEDQIRRFEEALKKGSGE